MDRLPLERASNGGRGSLPEKVTPSLVLNEGEDLTREVGGKGTGKDDHGQTRGRSSQKLVEARKICQGHCKLFTMASP